MPGGSAVPRAKMSWTSGHPSAPAVGAGPLMTVITDSATATTARPITGHPRRRIRQILTYTGADHRSAKPEGPVARLLRPRCAARIVAGLGSPTVAESPPAPVEPAQRAAQVIGERTGTDEHDVAVVLGSGWAPAVAALGSPTVTLPQSELPGFAPPRAVGHTGELMSVPIGGHRVLVLAGRVHAYEGHDLAHVVHAVRTA